MDYILSRYFIFTVLIFSGIYIYIENNFLRNNFITSKNNSPFKNKMINFVLFVRKNLISIDNTPINISRIPDKEIRNLIKEINSFQQTINYFYRKISYLFITISILNIIILLFHNTPIYSKNEIIVFFVFIFVAYVLSSLTEVIEQDGNLSLTAERMHDMNQLKNSIYNLYNSINYTSIYSDAQSIYEKDRLKYLKFIKKSFFFKKIGFFLWYTGWIFFYFTP